MKSKVLGGAVLAAAAAALALSNAVPAQAKGKQRHAAKPAAEKHGCGGKNGCPTMKKSDNPADAPKSPADAPKSEAAKPDAAKPQDSKPAEGK